MPQIELRVNGASHRAQTDDQRSLLSVLRDDLGLTGAKYGCGEGDCGACTVIIDGLAVRSCKAKVGTVSGRNIVTIEGLEEGGRLHPVQQAFVDASAMQCGYCISGMIMSSVALLKKNAQPSDAEILRAMDGNICRCGTHPRILAAIRAAGAAMGGSR
jgi:aerobic-type carbon monoxide dehydrogenase small subunit (CoxS/CutS family)